MKSKILMLMAAMGAGWLAHAEVPQRAEAKQILEAYRVNHGDSGLEAAGVPDKTVEQTRMCSYCHGEDGNSTHPEIPSLAGQNPQYIIEQLLLFRLKIRQYPMVMHDYSQQMNNDSMAAIALHFSALPRRAKGGVDSKKAAAGAAIYKDFCSNCHGKDGRGDNEGYSAINAQSPVYIALTLKRFRDNPSERSSHAMQIASRGMTDQEIDALANYIAGL